VGARSVDVVVLGGGPAGSTAAATLARKSISVLVVEAQKTIPFKVGESIPGIAGSVLARAGFHGVLGRVAQLRCSGNRSSWGSSELRSRDGVLNPYGGGAHVDRVQFDQQLLGEAVSAGARVWRGVSFHSAVRSQRGWSLFFRAGGAKQSLECESVIDCTGRKAAFARAHGVERIVVDQQVALVVALTRPDHFPDNDLTTTIESRPEGWWYTAQVPARRRVAVFFSDGNLLRQLRARSAEGVVHLMRSSTHIRKFLELGYNLIGEPEVVLADTSHLACSAGYGWCAAGDAAVALDPLASAGIVDAIRSGRAAAELVLSGCKNAEDYSDSMLKQANHNIKTRLAYYRMEARWPVEPFWAHRRSWPRVPVS